MGVTQEVRLIPGWVGPAVAIKYKRVRNIDTGRLQMRLWYLNSTQATWAYRCDGRNELMVRARERMAIEAELVRRGEMED